MFKNLILYRLPKAWAVSAHDLSEQLAALPLRDCGATDTQSRGWLPPRDGGSFAHVVNRQILLKLGIDEKLLPTSVVNQFSADKAKAIEQAEGRRVGRKEMREIREEMTRELLPRAFVRRRTTSGWIDPVNGWLVIDTAAPAKAEEFLELLRKSVDGLPVKALRLIHAPAAMMTSWIAESEAPAGFTYDQDLDLCSAEHAQVRYVKHSLDGDDIRQQIADGKAATKLAMTWSDRISFVVTENLQIKRLALLDVLKEQNSQVDSDQEQFDCDFALMTGELARMLDDLVTALGGEQQAGGAT